MNCHVCIDHLDEFRSGELAESMRQLVQEHLEQCEECRAELAEQEALSEDLKILRPDFALSAAEKQRMLGAALNPQRMNRPAVAPALVAAMLVLTASAAYVIWQGGDDSQPGSARRVVAQGPEPEVTAEKVRPENAGAKQEGGDLLPESEAPGQDKLSVPASEQPALFSDEMQQPAAPAAAVVSRRLSALKSAAPASSTPAHFEETHSVATSSQMGVAGSLELNSDAAFSQIASDAPERKRMAGAAPTTTGEEWYRRAEKHWAEGQLELAAEAYKQASRLTTGPLAVQANIRLAQIAIRAKDFDMAKLYYSRIATPTMELRHLDQVSSTIEDLRLELDQTTGTQPQ